MIVLGALAILYPFFATVFTFNVLGFVLLLFGILQLAYIGDKLRLCNGCQLCSHKMLQIL